VKLIPVYDRSELIRKTIGTVKETILEVVITVVLIILVFLWHFPSAAIPLSPCRSPCCWRSSRSA